jgi:ribosome-associated protein
MTISKRTFEITQVAAQAAIDKIADDVIALDLSEQLVLSEVFLIATGKNEAQVDAIADEVERIATRAKLIRWTDYLANSFGELDFAKMEKPQSVHLSREFYPHWTGIEKDLNQNNSLDSFFL